MQPKTRFDYTVKIADYTFGLTLWRHFGTYDYSVDYKGRWLGEVECRAARIWQAELARASVDSPMVHRAPGHFKSLEEGIRWIVEMYGGSYLLKREQERSNE